MSRVLLIVTVASLLAAPALLSVGFVMAAAPDGATASHAAGEPAVDATAPVTLAEGVDERWHGSVVSVRLTASDDDSGVASTFHRLNDGEWAAGTNIDVRAPSNHRGDGEHTVAFYSVDNAGNAEAVQSVVVRIDTTAPVARWRSLSPGIVYDSRSVRLRFSVREPSGSVKLAVVVFDQYGHRVLRKRGLRREPGLRTLDLAPRYRNHAPFMPGLYRVRLRITDQAGNVTVTRPWGLRDYRPAAARVWRHVSGAGRRVALTFDDGGAGWAGILRTLKAYHAHATFFPLGPYIGGSLARKTVAGGHAVGSHGWTHSVMTGQGYDVVRGELVRTISPWWAAAAATPVPYCRPPYGECDSTVLAAAGSAGFTRVILWDVDPQDWSQPGSAAIAQRVLSHVHPGAIVVMHLLPQTAAALPAILRGLRARGYKAVSVPELFRAAGYR